LEVPLKPRRPVAMPNYPPPVGIIVRRWRKSR